MSYISEAERFLDVVFKLVEVGDEVAQFVHVIGGIIVEMSSLYVDNQLVHVVIQVEPITVSVRRCSCCCLLNCLIVKDPLLLVVG
jgi:hypothetical protein